MTGLGDREKATLRANRDFQPGEAGAEPPRSGRSMMKTGCEHLGAQGTQQPHGRGRGPSGRDEVIDQNDLFATGDAILVDLDLVAAVLEASRRGATVVWGSFPFLRMGTEPCSEPGGQWHRPEMKKPRASIPATRSTFAPVHGWTNSSTTRRNARAFPS